MLALTRMCSNSTKPNGAEATTAWVEAEDVAGQPPERSAPAQRGFGSWRAAFVSRP